MLPFILALGLGFIPASIASGKGRSFGAWYIYGVLLFIVALPHALIIEPRREDIEQKARAQGMKRCPFCAEMVQGAAVVCRYCGRDLPVVATAPAPELIAGPRVTCASCGTRVPESGATYFKGQWFCRADYNRVLNA